MRKSTPTPRRCASTPPSHAAPCGSKSPTTASAGQPSPPTAACAAYATVSKRSAAPSPSTAPTVTEPESTPPYPHHRRLRCRPRLLPAVDELGRRRVDVVRVRG